VILIVRSDVEYGADRVRESKETQYRPEDRPHHTHTTRHPFTVYTAQPRLAELNDIMKSACNAHTIRFTTEVQTVRVRESVSD
jgi:hypothetical protein